MIGFKVIIVNYITNKIIKLDMLMNYNNFRCKYLLLVMSIPNLFKIFYLK